VSAAQYKLMMNKRTYICCSYPVIALFAGYDDFRTAFPPLQVHRFPWGSEE